MQERRNTAGEPRLQFHKLQKMDVATEDGGDPVWKMVFHQVGFQIGLLAKDGEVAQLASAVDAHNAAHEALAIAEEIKTETDRFSPAQDKKRAKTLKDNALLLVHHTNNALPDRLKDADHS